MKNLSFIVFEDDFKLDIQNEYIIVHLSSIKELEAVNGDQLNCWFTIDGRRIIEVRDKDGEVTGNCAFIILGNREPSKVESPDS